MFHLRHFTLFFSCILLLIVFSSHGSEIVNGSEVVPHSLPYMALLLNNKPVCGGVLIDPFWVLTAAHCSDIKEVWLGVHSIKAAEKNARQIQKVKKQYRHPCYDTTENVNDLMLLKLQKKVKETDTVKCLKLGKAAKDPQAGTKCTVAGWGQTKFKNKEMSDVLRSVTVAVVDRRVCNSPAFYDFNPVITRGMICAGSDGKHVADTCTGDSGGPLLCNGELLGVTSFGEKCGLIKKPGVYTFLSVKQLSWVKETMKKSDA
ncbi:granzyme A-like [Solea senegalensis]|uniref:Granzyme A-like n=2 Tax=Solea senegalensis TaxID=28829 RepID=A0AAV6QHJ3_SOLSE|nr:granzyme A-like [Solea senegalensis]KAG7489970.1 granzyme A-like [Solea senegalensis]